MKLLNRLMVRVVSMMPRALVWQVAKKYVAGDKLDDAVRIIRNLQEEGAMATVDLLGEEVRDAGTTEEATEEYLRILEAIDREQLDANISVKLTSLGLQIDETLCRDNLKRIGEAALDRGNFVRIDMEDHTVTDATLSIYRDMQERYGNFGVALQAYMRRILRDIAELPDKNPNIRLCKGIYIEPQRVAWQGYDTVRQNFIDALEKLMSRDAYVGIATHDEFLACASCAIVDRHRKEREEYEFQSLLGVEEPLRRNLVAEGHRLRVYVPYGRDWYLYSVRRLRENPSIAGHAAKSFLGLR